MVIIHSRMIAVISGTGILLASVKDETHPVAKQATGKEPSPEHE